MRPFLGSSLDPAHEDLWGVRGSSLNSTSGDSNVGQRLRVIAFEEQLLGTFIRMLLIKCNFQRQCIYLRDPIVLSDDKQYQEKNLDSVFLLPLCYKFWKWKKQGQKHRTLKLHINNEVSQKLFCKGKILTWFSSM